MIYYMDSFSFENNFGFPTSCSCSSNASLRNAVELKFSKPSNLGWLIRSKVTKERELSGSRLGKDRSIGF